MTELGQNQNFSLSLFMIHFAKELELVFDVKALPKNIISVVDTNAV